MVRSNNQACSTSRCAANANMVQAVSDRVARAIRVANSKVPWQALLHTTLLILGAIVLYSLAVIAYFVFYQKYLPDQVATVPVHLQYGYGEAKLLPLRAQTN